MAGLPPYGGSGLKCTAQRFFAVVIRLPPYGGSGLKFPIPQHTYHLKCLPPYGGSGLKSRQWRTIYKKYLSPSIRREWIEITMQIQVDKDGLSLPPYGGSGLK